MDFITVYVLSVIFILGATIGSFLNVCIYRIPAGLSIVKPRSRCGTCERTLTAIDLVPILSWVFLKGKCRTCGAKIAIRYPLVEAMEGILFVLVFMRFGFSWMTPIMWLFKAIMTVVFFIDLDHQIIPNKVVVFGLIVGIVPALYHWIQVDGYPFYFTDAFYEPLLGLFAPFTLMLSLALFSVALFKRSGLGMGDVKIYTVIGLFIGWQFSLLSIWLAFFFGGFFGLIWIFILKKPKEAMIPFAPFIVIGSMITVFYGAEVMRIINR